MIVIFFRDYLSHAKADSVICRISSDMKIKSVPPPPTSLSQNGMLSSGVKSQLLDIVEQGTNITYEEPNQILW